MNFTKSLLPAFALALISFPLAAAPGGFEVNPDYVIERVASEPIVMDPVEIVWDEQGRLFVMEMGGYPIALKKDGKDPGVVAMIEDTDADGVYDRRTVFADDLKYASSILPYDGGLFVASPPDLLYLKDTDGDHRADHREVIFGGFTLGNSQHNFCGLKMGLDGWVYGANGGNNGKVYRPSDRLNSISISGRDFRFHPKTLAFETTGRSSGGYGLAFDNFGRYLSTHNLYPVFHLVYPDRYSERNPHLRDIDSLIQIDADRKNGLSPLYAIGEPETRVNHPEQSGYFSGACGIGFYAGGLFPEAESDSIFVADVVTNLAFRSVLRPEGPVFTAERIEAEKRREFAATTDRDSRPVNFATGPDGAIYMVDFYRDEIEHPEWIPDELEKDMDVRAGETQGRLYRFYPRGIDLKPAASLRFHASPENLDAVVERLNNPNRWWRDTAQQQLVRWNAPGTKEKVAALATSSESPLGRLHALWTLENLGALDESLLLERLSDTVAGLRENAIQIAERRIKTSAPVRDALLSMRAESDPRVRMQLMLTLGELASSDDSELLDRLHDTLTVLISTDLKFEWSRNAFLTTAGHHPAELLTRLFASLSSHLESPDADAALDLLGGLSGIIGAKGDQAETRGLLQQLALPTTTNAVRITLLDQLHEGLAHDPRPDWLGHSDPEIETSIRSLLASDSIRVVRSSWGLGNLLGVAPGPDQLQMLADARDQVQDTTLAESVRLDALSLIELAPYDDRVELLFELLDPRTPGPIQQAAIEQLTHGPNDQVVPRLIEMWKSLGPGVRQAAGNMLLFRGENHGRLLDAFESGDILIGQMNMDLERRRVLLRSRDPRHRSRAEALFTDAGVVTRAAAIEKMKPALDLNGSVEKGKVLFTDLCSRCHTIGGEGHDVGPNLTEVFRKSKATLMHDILDPNAAVNTEYISYTIETTDGEIRSGLLHSESPTHVTLREGGGVTTAISRDQIDRMWSSGLSLMPEELEVEITPEAFADLLAFLQLPR